MTFAQHPTTRLFWNGTTFAVDFDRATPVTATAARLLAWLHNAVTMRMTVDD